MVFLPNVVVTLPLEGSGPGVKRFNGELYYTESAGGTPGMLERNLSQHLSGTFVEIFSVKVLLIKRP